MEIQTAYERETQALLDVFARLEAEIEAEKPKSATPVTVVLKPRKAANKGIGRPDPLEKVEYAPDNSRIGCESLGFQSGKYAAPALFMGDWDSAARYMVAEHLELKQGIVRILPVISRTELVEPAVPASKVYGCATEPKMLRKLDPVTEEYLLRMARDNQEKVFSPETENKSWKQLRSPRTGQRPQVLSKLLTLS